MTIEFTGFDRPRRLASSTHLSNMDIDGELTFDAVPKGTRMQWVWALRPRGTLKVMTPIVAHMGQRQERTIWANLKRVLEAQDTSRSGSVETGSG